MRRLALVGFMGSGKTTIGSRLSESLSLPFIDLDDEIVRFTGQTIPQIFAAEGESGFRAYEYKVLCTTVHQTDGSVLSTGGGLITQQSAREILIGNYYVIFLDVPFVVAMTRIKKDGDTRPLAQNSPDALLGLEKLYNIRRPIYESVANFQCEISNQEPEYIVSKILAHLKTTEWGK